MPRCGCRQVYHWPRSRTECWDGPGHRPPHAAQRARHTPHSARSEHLPPRRQALGTPGAVRPALRGPHRTPPTRCTPPGGTQGTSPDPCAPHDTRTAPHTAHHPHTTHSTCRSVHVPHGAWHSGTAPARGTSLKGGGQRPARRDALRPAGKGAHTIDPIVAYSIRELLLLAPEYVLGQVWPCAVVKRLAQDILLHSGVHAVGSTVECSAEEPMTSIGNAFHAFGSPPLPPVPSHRALPCHLLPSHGMHTRHDGPIVGRMYCLFHSPPCHLLPSHGMHTRHDGPIVGRMYCLFHSHPYPLSPVTEPPPATYSHHTGCTRGMTGTLPCLRRSP